MQPELTNPPVIAVLESMLLLPALAFLGTVLPRLSGLRTSERYTFELVRLACILGLGAFSVLAARLLLGIDEARTLALGEWFAIGHDPFELTLVIDILALAYGGFSLFLVGLVAAFSQRYLHRELGYHRFYALLMLFSLGLNLVSFAGSLDILLVGWELVGVSSVLLIAFFNHRPDPVRNALRAFVTYRLCDIGLVLAILLLHPLPGHTAFHHAAGTPWLGLTAPPNALLGLGIGAALLFGAMGKSAQVPFSGWLPRAMEGPTPSSAVFYGALSIHLGPFLLLRSEDVVAGSLPVAIAVIGVGLASAWHGRRVGAVQTDIKSRLAYGSITQTGLILVEIGLGFGMLALVHMLGHAGYRTVQILRAPSLLHDRHHIEQMLGHHLSVLLAPQGKEISGVDYRRALSRGGWDTLLVDRIVGGTLRTLRAIDAAEQGFTNALAARLTRPFATRQAPQTAAAKEQAHV